MKPGRRKNLKPGPKKIKDRIRELRRVQAADLLPNPRNWRTHPRQQRDALRDVLTEIGYANALLARETADGRLTLIDGHLRAETTPDASVPVLVLDLTDEEADQVLATLDPLSSLASCDPEKITQLFAENESAIPALRSLFPRFGDRRPPRRAAKTDKKLPEQFSIIITCTDEQQQIELLQRFTDEELQCRALIA